MLALTHTSVKHFVFEAGKVQFEKSVFVPGICLHLQLLQRLLQIALQKQCITMISVRVNRVRYWLFPNTCVVDASLRDGGVPQLVILIKKKALCWASHVSHYCPKSKAKKRELEE